MMSSAVMRGSSEAGLENHLDVAAMIAAYNAVSNVPARAWSVDPASGSINALGSAKGIDLPQPDSRRANDRLAWPMVEDKSSRRRSGCSRPSRSTERQVFTIAV